jgi:hypothetical protein
MYYTRDQQERAARAVQLHNAMSHPSDAALIAMLQSPSFINCPITASDVVNARAIFGPCPQCSEGKPFPTTGNNPTYQDHNISMPGQMLHVDIVFINKQPYLFSVDDISHFMSIVRLVSKKTSDLSAGLPEDYSVH